MPPDYVTKLIAAGANVELEQRYPPDLVTVWVTTVAQLGTHITVVGP